MRTITRSMITRPMNLQLFGDGDATPDKSADFYAKMLKETREEAAEHRVKAREAEKQRDEALAKLKEIEGKPSTLLDRARGLLKLDAKADEAAIITALETTVNTSGTIGGKAKQALLAAAWMQAAQKAGVVSPEDALKLADLTGVDVDLDTHKVLVKGTDGKPLQKDGKDVTLETIVADLVTAKPFLKGATQQQAGGGFNPAGGNNAAPDYDAIGKMSMAEYEAWRKQTQGGKQ